MKTQMSKLFLKPLFLLLLGCFSTEVFAQVLKENQNLKAIEKKYQSSKSIQMAVTKKLKIELLNKEKQSTGYIKILKGGKFKWQITEPEKSEIILTPKEVWVVDYPLDEKEKISVIKSRKPRKTQSPAVISFLIGQGGLTKNFKIVKTDIIDNQKEKISLEAKSDKEQIKNIQVVINKVEKLIEEVSFTDHLSNRTLLIFKDVKFNEKIKEEEFIFTPPKGADVTIID